MILDKDLQSLQEVRDLLRHAQKAQEIIKTWSQEKVDQVVQAMAQAATDKAQKLAQEAVEETGFGVFQDKVVKNLFASKVVYEFIKDLKTVGVITKHPELKVVEIAEPMGVIAAIIPSTNPTSTTIYKGLICIKSRNTIVMSPHPSALQCTRSAAKIISEAALAAGAPEGCIGCMSSSTLAGTNELMRHEITSLILATGGTAMVQAAYSAGKPAYGVGPGNVPAYLDKSAKVKQAVVDVIKSKTFDNGTVCASEQAFVVEKTIEAEVRREIKTNGGYFLNPEEADRVAKILVKPNLLINPKLVGQSAKFIAEQAGVKVPQETRLLVAELAGVGPQYPLSVEKLSPVIAYYVVDDWLTGCKRCIEILNFGGIGHTMVIHSNDEYVIGEFALKKPAFRILVNTPATHGAIGLTTGLAPALTLGCGSWGGGISADNITPLHLLNTKRLAYHNPRAAVAPQANEEKDFSPAIKKEFVHKNLASFNLANIDPLVVKVVKEVLESQKKTSFLKQ